MITEQTHRAREILTVVGQTYPSTWQQAESFRALRGKDLPDWPEWCYLPMHGAYAIVSGGGDNRVPFERWRHVGIVGGLAAWRMGQQIIRYDHTLYQSLIDTPISGDLPTELLYRLPAWCLYIETPGLDWVENQTLHGFFVSLDWDDRKFNELRLLLDIGEPSDALDPDRGLVPVPLILGEGTIADAVDRVIGSGAEQAAKEGAAADLRALTEAARYSERIAKTLAPLISLVLYLCSDRPDWDLEAPKNPPAVKTKHGLRTLPVPQPRVWDVGVRIGAAIHAAQSSSSAPSSGTHAGPRAHIRRAHWHTYLTGTGRAKHVLKWLHPILVKADTQENLPATIRTVSGKEQ